MDEKKIKEIEERRKSGVKKCLLPSCNAIIPQTSIFCPICGSRQVPWAPLIPPPTQNRKCPHCLKQLNDTDIYLCPHCAGLLKSDTTNDYSQKKYKEYNEDDNEDDVGFTHYYDLYPKKSYKQAELERHQKEYGNLSKKEKEKIYEKHAVSPLWGILIIPINVFIFISYCSGGIEYLLDEIKFVCSTGVIFLYFMVSLIFSLPVIYIFAIWAIHHNKEWRHKLQSSDIKRDAIDNATIVALGVATKQAAKNAKDAITKPLEPKEVHF